MSLIYKTFVNEITRLSTTAPKGKYPRDFNLNQLVQSPFHKPQQIETQHSVQTKLIAQRSAQFTIQQEGQFCTDIPFPKCLQRHVNLASPSMMEGKGAEKVSGFMIMVKGRRGTRSSVQYLKHGKLNLKQRDSEFCDYARSFYVHKKGVTGVRAWVGFNR